MIIDRPRPNLRSPRGLLDGILWLLAPRRIRLDGIGSFAWRRLDGVTKVRTLAGVMREAFPDSRHQIEERLGAYLRAMRRLRLIGILWGVTVFYGAGLAGLAGRVMMPDLADGEDGSILELGTEARHRMREIVGRDDEPDAGNLLGFGGIAAFSANVAQVLFVVFLVLFAIALVSNAVRGRYPR